MLQLFDDKDKVKHAAEWLTEKADCAWGTLTAPLNWMLEAPAARPAATRLLTRLLGNKLVIFGV